MKKIPIERLVAEKLSGLGITEDDIKRALWHAPLESREFATGLRKESKPIIIAANKMDVPSSAANLERIKKGHKDIIPTSAESELALREAAEHRLIEYTPGDPDFKIVSAGLSEKQRKALEFIRENVLKEYGSTGVQNVLNRLVFDVLGYVAVYPVANISHLTDTRGNVLPDTFLVKKGTTLREFAAKIHTDLAEKFIGGLDIHRKKVGADYRVQDGDVLEILFSR
jgi:ribosome-binding ATPase YchF (GTP1/OBG family)